MKHACIIFLLSILFQPLCSQVNETEAKAALILAEEYCGKANYLGYLLF